MEQDQKGFRGDLMAEYIEREALIGKIKGFTSDVIFRGSHNLMLTGKDSCNPAEWTRGYEQGVLDTNNLIAQTPAADVVEICRCRDCKHLKDGYKCYCPLGAGVGYDGGYMMVDEDDFCSYGEKRAE